MKKDDVVFAQKWDEVIDLPQTDDDEVNQKKFAFTLIVILCVISGITCAP